MYKTLREMVNLFLTSKIYSPDNQNTTKPQISGGFGDIGYVLSKNKHPELFEQDGHFTLDLSEQETQKLELPKGFVIQLFRKPTESTPIFVYRIDVEADFIDLGNGQLDVLWQDAILVFYSFEENGRHYAIKEYHYIDELGVASAPCPEIILKYSGKEKEYLELWTTELTTKHNLLLGNFSFHKNLAEVDQRP
ncbi:hypothetical protein RJ45_09405 [Photobacterium gaetbulicola]|uniref:Uncharacterized protein n=1 Tax=Photobacterium gaetbulicola TaxID=1295392 RepID=A0A0B9H4U0_9GAMM|nr:hypothetical protein [Photobacterium gaetbulicola]KHT63907.1 hypothetical protein RJ45_09405 [Photobacterium gaetbulicola]